MTLSFRPFPFSPVRVPWDAEITEFVWNDHFCDIQTRGPFAYWRHCHRLEAQTRDGVAGCLVRDAVEYELPLGGFGNFFGRFPARWQMRGIFNYRHKRTEELMPLA